MSERPSIEQILSFDAPRLKSILSLHGYKYRSDYDRVDLVALTLNALGYNCPNLSEFDVIRLNRGENIDLRVPMIVRGLLPRQRINVNTMLRIYRDRLSALDSSETGAGKTRMFLATGVLLKKKIFIVTLASIISDVVEVIVGHDIQNVIGVASYSGLVSQTPKHTDPYKYSADNPDKSKVPTPYVSRFTTKKKASARETKEKTSFVWTGLTNTLIVFDEIHKAKNDVTLTNKLVTAAYEFLKNDPAGNQILYVGATPSDKRKTLVYLAYLLGIIERKDERDFKVVLRSVSGATDFIKMNNLIFNPSRPLGTRITKAEIEEDLGIHYPVSVNFQAYEMDDAAEKEIEAQNRKIAESILSMRSKQSKSALAEITKSRRIIELQKVPTMISLALGAIGRKRYVIIFVEYHETSLALVNAEQLEKYKPQRITGEMTNMAERARITRDFQLGRFEIIIMHFGLAVGISLHDLVGNKPRTVLLNSTWGGIPLLQALGRADRLCKKSDVEQIVIFAKSAKKGAVSMDQRLASVMSQKLRNIKQLDMGEDADDFMRTIYSEAVKKILTGGPSPERSRITIDLPSSEKKPEDTVCKLENIERRGQQWPFDGIKAIGFDFDGTLIPGNVCNVSSIVTSAAAAASATSTSSISFFSMSIPLIKYFLLQGFFVFIASFGDKDMIADLLRSEGIDIPIFTPMSIGFSDCNRPFPDKTKNDLLELATKRFQITPEQLLLIDDNLDNVIIAVSGNYRAIYLPGGLGTITISIPLDSGLSLEEFREEWRVFRLQEGYWTKQRILPASIIT